MRTYPRNSPEAAARIVALVLISDGHVCRSEIDALNSLHLERELGLPGGAFPHVVHTLCEDLLMGAHDGASTFGSVDESTLASLLDEISDKPLQRKVLDLALAAAEADRHMAEGETIVMSAARRRWRLDDAVSGASGTSPMLHPA
jgi:hypothetical protein